MSHTALAVIAGFLVQFATGIYKGDATLIGSAVLTLVALWVKSPSPDPEVKP